MTNNPFGAYYIAREYLDALQKADTHVPKHDYEDNGGAVKFYCGPVMNKNGIDYYAPVSSKNNKNMYINGSKENGVAEYFGVSITDNHFNNAGCIDCRFLIPIVDDRFIKACTPSGYGATQMAFCKHNQHDICKTASATYDNIVSNDYSKLTENSINDENVLNASWEFFDKMEELQKNNSAKYL